MFNLEEEIKKLKKRGPDNPLPPQKMAKILSAVLDQAVSQEAFRFFQDKNFRRLAEFNKLEQLEQDRIFNELVLAGIVLLMLTFEAPDLRVPKEFKDYLLLVKEEIPKAHLDQLKQLGIEKKYLNDWEKLIKMRYDEYQKDRLEARMVAMEVESREKELMVADLEKIHLLLPAQTVAIGCHHHICRGKTKRKDELFKLIFKWLGRFYVEIRVPIEGGKITPWKRFWVKMKHFWGRLP